jgi:hypothetical protein
MWARGTDLLCVAVAMAGALGGACKREAGNTTTAAPPAAPPQPPAPPPVPLPPFLTSAAPGVPVTLNLADPAQRAFLLAQLDGTPFTEAATPQLHRVIAAMGAAPAEAKTIRQMAPPPDNQPVDLLDLVGALSDPTGAYQATAVASAVGRSSFVHLVLRIIDAASHQPVGAPQATSSYTGVDAQVTAIGRLPRADARATAIVTALFTPYACPPDVIDCFPRPGLGLLGAPSAAPPPALTTHVSGAPYAQVMVKPIDAVATAPAAPQPQGAGPPQAPAGVISPAAPPQPTAPLGDGGIMVCLGRQPGSSVQLCQPDGGVACTYCDPTQGATQTPLLRLPLSGSVNLRYPSPAPTITQFSSYMIPATGGGCKQYNITSTPTGAFTAINNGMTVRWYFGQNNYDSAKWAQYGQLTSGSNCWTAVGEPILFQLQFTINDNQNNTVPITIADFGAPNSNSAIVPTTSLAYGCLAAGTPVLMADGKSKPVEAIVVGDYVKSDAAGTARRVDMTYLGSEFLPLVRITTANHKTATVTAGHPMAGSGGMVLAQRIAVGAKLMTIAGPSAVTKVEPVPPKPNQGVRVYNIDVGAVRGGGGPPLGDTNRTLFAGGLLVGDNFTQRLELRRAHTPAAGGPLPVPPAWAAELALSMKLRQAAPGGQP